MPTYEYKCDECSYEFEDFQSISSSPNSVCPRCSSIEVKRNISGGSGIIFKGSGFYINDYKKEKNEHPKGQKNNNSSKT